MLKFIKIDNNKLGIQFKGSNWTTLKDMIRSFGGFRFEKSFSTYTNIYVGHKKTGKALIPVLCEIEGEPIPVDLIEYCDTECLETKFFRRLYRKRLFKGEPLGPYQLRGIKQGVSQNRYMLAWEMRLGKPSLLSSKIYTPNGYKVFKDIKVGDDIFNKNGGVSKVVAIHPQGKLDAYEVEFTDGSKTHCGVDHLWDVQTVKQRSTTGNYQTISLREIIERGHKLKNPRSPSKFFIPITEPVKFRKQDLFIHPYLMGCLLSDGSFRSRNLSWAKVGKEHINKIKNLLPKKFKLTTKKDEKGHNIVFSGKGNPMIDEIKRLGLWGKLSINKFIPDAYKYNSVENRIALLQGLIDSDGSFYIQEKNNRKINNLEFYTSSKKLKNGVKELIQSLGGVCSVRSKTPKYKYRGETRIGHKAYSLRIRVPDYIVPVTLKKYTDIYNPAPFAKPMRAFKNITYVGKKECMCITTSSPDGLYLTDEFIVTHNSPAVITIMNHLIEDGDIDKILIIAPPESIYNMKRELLKWNTFGLTEVDFYIANTKNRDPFNSGKKVVMMTYRTFLMLSDEAYFKKRKKRSKDYKKPVLPIDEWGENRAIILDESQRIARRKSRQTKVLHLHKEYFKYRYLLSGTPEPNKKIEGWYSQITFMDPETIPMNFYGWLATVAKLGNPYSNYAVAEYLPDKIDKFIESIRPWVSREFIEGNLDLPSLIFKKNYIPLNRKQSLIYQEVTKSTLKKIKDKYGAVEKKRVVSNLPHIMLALDNPCILKQTGEKQLDSLLKKWKFTDHSKLEACSSLLDQYINEEGRKVVLWSGHPMTIDSLVGYYKKYNPIGVHGKTVVPKGLTDAEYRDQLLEKFKHENDCKLLIASYLVLHTSISITEATRSIYFDRSWNFEYFLQSQRRNTGPKQKDRVVCNLLIMENSLDERLDLNLEGKNDIHKYLMDKEYLGKEDWEKLFQSDD